MEQEHSKVDDLLKKLHSYEGEPMANSWEKISARLEEDEEKVIKLKRDRKIYLIGIAASLAVMVSLALFILSNTNIDNLPLYLIIPLKKKILFRRLKTRLTVTLF